MTSHNAFVLTVLILLYCGFSIPAPAGEPPKGISVVAVGQVDTNLLNRTATYLQKHYHCSVRQLKCISKPASDPMVEIESVRNTSADVCVLALVAVEERTKSKAAVSIAKGVALLNLHSLQLGLSGDSDNREEAYARRVEKESVNMIAQALGIPTCPVIRCARFDAKVPQLLDAKSRTLCPPCQMKARKALRNRGVELTFDVDPRKIKSDRQK